MIGDLKVTLPATTFAIAFVLQDLPPVDECSNEMTFGPAAPSAGSFHSKARWRYLIESELCDGGGNCSGLSRAPLYRRRPHARGCRLPRPNQAKGGHAGDAVPWFERGPFSLATIVLVSNTAYHEELVSHHRRLTWRTVRETLRERCKPT
jgi:hypothetical protein